MRDTTVTNAIIDYTKLGPGASGQGIFSASVGVTFESSGQTFGGYGLDEPIFDGIPKFEHDKRGTFLRREGTAWGMEFIARILAVLEIDTWEQLKGVPCRIEHEHTKIHAIGHFYKDRWFNPEKDLTHLLPAS